MAPQAPPHGVGYPAVLQTSEPLEGARRALLGIVLALGAFGVVMPLVADLLLRLTWLVSGRAGEFTAYKESALGFGLVEGLVATNLAIAALGGCVVLIVRFVHRRDPQWLWSVQPGFRWRYALACSLVSVVVLNGVYWVSRGVGEFVLDPVAGIGWWLVAIVVTAPLQAAAEEMMYRGYLVQASGIVAGRGFFAISVAAFVFAFMHGVQDPALFIDRLAFGLIAGGLVLATGGLEATIAVHAVNNVFAFGYAAASSTLVDARGMESSTWATTAWNIVAYLVVALVCRWIGRKMNVATATPSL